MYTNGNLFLTPFCNSFMGSTKSKSPKFQEAYWSLNTSVTVNSKSLTIDDNPFAVTNPTGLNTSPTLKLYPFVSRVKSVTVNNVEPIPTLVFAAPTPIVNVAPVPVSVVEPIPLLDTPVTGRFWYEGAETWICGLV